MNAPFTAFLDADGTPADAVPEGVPQTPLVTCCAKGISSRFVAQFLAREGWEMTALADGAAAVVDPLDTTSCRPDRKTGVAPRCRRVEPLQALSLVFSCIYFLVGLFGDMGIIIGHSFI